MVTLNTKQTWNQSFFLFVNLETNNEGEEVSELWLVLP